MKQKLFLFLCTLLTMIGVQNVKAYTVDDLTNAGWTQVTSSLTDVNSKYFILIDAGNAYTSGMSVKHNANDSGSLYYQALGHPLSKNQMWKLSENDGKYTIQALNDDCFVNANTAGWNRSVDALESTGKYYITFSGGIWHINNTGTYNKGNTAFGPWNGTRTDGTEMNVAINKEDKQTSGVDGYAPGFYLYSLPRPQDVTSTYITNPSFETSASGGVAGIVTEAANASINGWTTTSDNEILFSVVNKSTDNNSGYGKRLTPADGDYYTLIRVAWNAGTGKVSQTLNNLLAGSYTLSVRYKAAATDKTTAPTLSITAEPEAGKGATGTKSTSNIPKDKTRTGDGSSYNFENVAWSTISTTFMLNNTANTTIEVSYNSNGKQNCEAIIDNFILTYEPFADAADYTALNAAIATAEAHPLGFGVGEYAPYTNKDALVLLADAKAIDQSGSNTQRDVRTATDLLNAATWTENTEEVNAFRWIISDYKDNTDSQIPLGFTNGDGNAIRISANYGKNAGLNQLSQKMCLNINTNDRAAIYGETSGYTMPLKANTVYKLTFSYAGWGDASGSPIIKILKEDNSELKSVTLDPTSIQGNSTPGPWTSATIVFQTTAAGNYKVSFAKSGNRTAFGNLELAAVAASATIGTTGWTTFASAYPLDLSGMSASTGDVKAYYASSVGDGKIVMTSTTSEGVAASTGLMLKGTAGATVTIPVAASGDAISGNMLVGCPNGETLTANANYYVLIKNGETAEFQSLKTNGATIPAGKAYLNTGVISPARLIISYDEEDPTAINAVEAVEANGDALKDGKYLIGNKVVLVKNGVKYGANGQKLN